MTQKVLSVLGLFFFMAVFFLLLWIWLDSEKVVPIHNTPQHCADLYHEMSANLKSQYYGPEDFINSCVE